MYINRDNKYNVTMKKKTMCAMISIYETINDKYLQVYEKKNHTDDKKSQKKLFSLNAYILDVDTEINTGNLYILKQLFV